MGDKTHQKNESIQLTQIIDNSMVEACLSNFAFLLFIEYLL